MEKLKLALESLEVTSFEAMSVDAAGARGAVQAEATPVPCSAIDACPSRLCTPRC